jgi:hypothetical protein
VPLTVASQAEVPFVYMAEGVQLTLTPATVGGGLTLHAVAHEVYPGAEVIWQVSFDASVHA